MATGGGAAAAPPPRGAASGFADVVASPYEPGLFFVPPEPGTTNQSVGMQEWRLGGRYALRRVVGYGSFSVVCEADDLATGERVALKRVGDVLQSADVAKHCLREVAIARRLAHPHVVGLRGAFLAPSGTGQCRLVGGRLEPLSVDLYLALEFCDLGDVFHHRGQLSAPEARELARQLLAALAHVHGRSVWHRDVKSSNAFLALAGGERVLKLGDFGSARPARPGGLARAATTVRAAPRAAAPAAGGGGGGAGSEMGDADDDASAGGDTGGDTGDDGGGGRRRAGAGAGAPASDGGFAAPLTAVVATPCYRAPEVVMAAGGYGAAVDAWGAGCVLGELLARVARVGSAATPRLRVAPLFAVRGRGGGGRDAGAGDAARAELDALFDVIGTPGWADAARAAPPGEWRAALARMPGRAPALARRFGAAGEPAVHLLGRLLEFDPRRRASAEEALAHEFFAADGGADGGDAEMASADGSAADLAGAGAGAGDDAPPSARVEALALGGGGEADADAGPAAELLALEAELEAAVAASAGAGAPDFPSSPAGRHLLELLRAEVEAAARQAAAGAARRAAPAAAPPPRRARSVEPGGSGIEAAVRAGPGLQVDAAAGAPGAEMGAARLPPRARGGGGAAAGALDPGACLPAGRHGEWAECAAGAAAPPPGPRWGVSSLPPGWEGADAAAQLAADPRLRAAVEKQQRR